MLCDGAALGDRFVAQIGTPDGPGWVAAADLFGAGLPGALHAVGTARGTESPAVAGALLLDVYAQRVAAPVLATLYREGHDIDARLPAVHVEPVQGRLGRLAFAHGPSPAGPDRDAARKRVAGRLVASNLELAADAVHRHTRAGPRVLRGAIANAVAITFLHLSWPDHDRARYVDQAQEFLAGVPGLADLVTVEAVTEVGQRWMYTARNTCCLAFRTTTNQSRDQPYCSACPVLPPGTTRSLFAQATATYAERHPRP